jgi:molybdopterin-guanine dinucleotide biosynthesis protein A
MRVAGFVLVGGQSTRMGQPKARLRSGSQLLVEEVAATVAELTRDVTLIGDPALYADLPFLCLPDLRPGLGPLSGLEAGLAANRGELNLFAACDLVGVDSAYLAQMLAVCRDTGSLCVLPRDLNGHTHPLFAVYRNTCLPFVQAALDARRLRLLDLVEELKAVEVPIDSVLTNVNTPEEWAAWQATQPV